MVSPDPKDSAISKQISKVHFGFYTDEDVRCRSVCEVTASHSLDALGNAMPGGLYDPRLGPSNTTGPPCPTCACRFLTCQGHFGHIELCVPVYHPLLFQKILLLLRTKCWNCHRLRAPPRALRLFDLQMKLLRAGRYVEVLNMDDTIAAAGRARTRGIIDAPTNDPAAKAPSSAAVARAVSNDVDAALRALENSLNDAEIDNERVMSSFEIQIRNRLIAELRSACKHAKSCPYCKACSPKIRQDSSNKLFQSPLSDKASRHNDVENIQFVPALETLLRAAVKAKRNNSAEEYDADDDMVMHDVDGENDKENGKGKKLDMQNMSDVREDRLVASSGGISQERSKKKSKVSEEEESESDDEEDDDDESDEVPEQSQSSAAAKKEARDNYIHAAEVRAQVQCTWNMHPVACEWLFGENGPNVFFMQAIPVPPSRFRPPMHLGGMVVEHSQNLYLSKILVSNANIRDAFADVKTEASAYQSWIELQTQVNCFMDSSKDPGVSANAPVGIRQLLERKEGIFRKHMMGKRVNFACRSVISPDPYVGTNEIGLPQHFAEVLTYPTPVTDRNVEEMRKLVERGAFEYPGARWIEFPDRRVELAKMDRNKREAFAARLAVYAKRGGKPAIVGRQLRDGDMVLMNRQPTLHKPGIMAHEVRVLHDPNQKTIRMHYANCNTYNADYDGDEMNCHFPQSDLARAEAECIAKTDLQFIVPTDGSPLRGLIQDHVVAGVKLTKRDTFLEKWEYQQLLFAALASLPRLELIRSDAAIEMMPPAILKPRQLWTGKQVITTLLNHLRKGNDRDRQTKEPFPGISTERKSKTPAVAFGAANDEHLVLIRDGELLRGVLDKSAYGSTDFSLVHAVYESYGPEKAGLLLNSLGRLFTAYLQYYSGHSCRMEDLMLTEEADKTRRRLVEKAYNLGSRSAKAWADSEGGKVPIDVDLSKAEIPLKPVEVATSSSKVRQLLSGTEGAINSASLDGFMMSKLNPLASDIVKACLPDGLNVPFPTNTFGIMVTTGAKGSIVNQSQVSCALGQQALEGRRVPRMSSGRTLPSFAPFDVNPRADGFVMDRFLTGIRPQEYYFHCMAGREGLVDTAVKTSRSGYLQRCLVKHLEELKVCYDYTVRNGEGGVVQFLYGEDGLDPTKASYLDCSDSSFEYMARNHRSLARRHTPLPGATVSLAASDSARNEKAKNNHIRKFKKGDFVRARRPKDGMVWGRGRIEEGWFDAVVSRTPESNARSLDIKYLSDDFELKNVPIEFNLGVNKNLKSAALTTTCTLVEPSVPDPILSSPKRSHRIGSSGACVSERLASSLSNCLKSDAKLKSAMESNDLSAKAFGKLVAAKFGTALCAPGEAVGSIAAQSIGEPSTQMTLNTFHLAGAGANVTLGIPRLREIIMTASRNLKTPTMSVPIDPSVPEREAVRLSRSFTKITLAELIAGRKGITVTETLAQGDSGYWERCYKITLTFHPAERMKEAFDIDLQDIARVVAKNFVPALSYQMKRELRRSAAEGDTLISSVEGGGTSDYVEDTKDGAIPSNPDVDILGDGDEGDNESENEFGDEDGVAASRGQAESYGVGDDAPPETISAPVEASDDEDDSEDEVEAVESKASSVMDNDCLKIDRKKNQIHLRPLRVDPATRPLLMIGLIEMVAAKTLVCFKKRIDQAFVNDEDGRGRCLQTAGINFEEIWKLSCVDHDKLMSNDTWAVRCAYGVEAARSNIVEQIRSVFGAYGIEVDPRHLSLIADYMTYGGDYSPMNRNGMKTSSSPFLQMSFETTATFMTDAAVSSASDHLASPSANIVVGRPIGHGTGSFSLLAK